MSHTPLPPTLAYAPQAKSSGRWIWVIVGGIVTTALTLAGASWLDTYTKGDFNIIGFYVWGIVPIGALGLGVVAATGYAIMAWLLGCRVDRVMLAIIAVVTLVAYGTMHYIEYKSHGPLFFKSTGMPISFLEYYDLTTRNMHFVSTDYTPPSTPNFGTPPPQQEQGLGTLGYGVRILEIGAFSLGAMLMPLLFLGRTLYCDLCQRYHTRIRLGVIPASIPLKKVMGFMTPTKATLDGEHAVVAQQATELLERLTADFKANDMTDVANVLADLQPGSRAAKKLPRRIELLLSRCRNCGQAVFYATMLIGIDARNTKKQELLALRLAPSVADSIRPR